MDAFDAFIDKCSVKVYGRNNCGFTRRLITHLVNQRIPFVFFHRNSTSEITDERVTKTTVPAIFLHCRASNGGSQEWIKETSDFIDWSARNKNKLVAAFHMNQHVKSKPNARISHGSQKAMEYFDTGKSFCFKPNN